MNAERQCKVDPEREWRFYLSGLPSYLESRIAGQSAAIGRIARAVQAAELGLNEGGSLNAVFCFLDRPALERPSPRSALLNIFLASVPPWKCLHE